MSNSKIGESDRFKEIAVTNWTDNGLFNIPVPSFSITIFGDDYIDSYSGTLCITPPNGKESSVEKITYISTDYLTLCHHLIMKCYKRCFLPVLTNMLDKFESTNQTIHKILTECGNQLLSRYGGKQGLLSKSDFHEIATNLVNNMRTYDLYIKTIVNEKDNSISNIYAISFEKHNVATICRVYHCDIKTYNVTLKGGFCYNINYNHRKQIYKSKLFGDDNEFWEMLFNNEFKLTAEYRYFREVIRHLPEFEPSSSGWSSISFDDEVIYTQNNLGYMNVFGSFSTCGSQLIIDSGVDSEELSSLVASKLNKIKAHQCYPILISSFFLGIDAEKEKEEQNIINSIKSNESNGDIVLEKLWNIFYGNETIDVDEL